jgi:hypothetical protein
MDFFHALDKMQHADLKKQLLNNWAPGAGKPPMTVNDMFALAKSRVTTVTKQTESGSPALTSDSIISFLDLPGDLRGCSFHLLYVKLDFLSPVQPASMMILDM